MLLFALVGLTSVAGFAPCTTPLSAEASTRRALCPALGTSLSLVRRGTPALLASARSPEASSNDANVPGLESLKKLVTTTFETCVFALSAFMVKWGMLLTLFFITPALAVSSANVPVNPERPKIELKVQQDTQKANTMKVVTVLSGVGLFVHSINAWRRVNQTSRRWGHN